MPAFFTLVRFSFFADNSEIFASSAALSSRAFAFLANEFVYSSTAAVLAFKFA
jgi:hypothetical protein